MARTVSIKSVKMEAETSLKRLLFDYAQFFRGRNIPMEKFLHTWAEKITPAYAELGFSFTDILDDGPSHKGANRPDTRVILKHEIKQAVMDYWTLIRTDESGYLNERMQCLRSILEEYWWSIPRRPLRFTPLCGNDVDGYTFRHYGFADMYEKLRKGPERTIARTKPPNRPLKDTDEGE